MRLLNSKVEGKKGQNNIAVSKLEEGQQAHITLIPFGCPPAQFLSVLLPFSDVALPVPAGCDRSCVHGGTQQDFALGPIFPGFYEEESKERVALSNYWVRKKKCVQQHKNKPVRLCS